MASRSVGLLAVHGGAGGLPRAALGRKQTEARLAIIRAALRAGLAALAGEGGPVAAVTAAVVVMEDAPELNAGVGCALTADGTVELSAAVADGGSGAFSGVASLSRTCNPVELARRFAAQEREVLMTGTGADAFADAWGLRTATAEYFVTEERLRAVRRSAGAGGTGRLDAGAMGTVGAVACTASGWLAAATSTGGLSGQRSGRVGDSPICGAGTWADNRTCAVSATGQGEAFMLSVFAHDVHARMLYGAELLGAACEGALASVTARGATGGCIAMSADGDLAMPFTTSAMLRGWAATDGRMELGIDPGDCGGW